MEWCPFGVQKANYGTKVALGVINNENIHLGQLLSQELAAQQCMGGDSRMWEQPQTVLFLDFASHVAGVLWEPYFWTDTCLTSYGKLIMFPFAF